MDIEYTLTSENPVTPKVVILECPGEEIKFKDKDFSYSPSGGNFIYIWTMTPFDPSFDESACQYPSSCHDPKAAPEKSTIYEVAKCLPDFTEISKAIIEVYVKDMVLHPIDEDFDENDNNSIGKAIIATRDRDSSYWTKKITTIGGKPAQSEDREITITAHLTPADHLTGETVYFRVIDPDDKSPYDSDSDGNDNKHQNDPGDPNNPSNPSNAGLLSATSAVAQQHEIEGKTVAAAEVTLTITDKHSGDNYLVEASLDPNFATKIYRTSILVAWKRLYLEQGRMCKKGATLTDVHNPNSGTLKVDNAQDFENGDEIDIWFHDPPGSGDITTIQTDIITVDTTTNNITIPNIDDFIYPHSGVKPKGYSEYLDLGSAEALKNGWGLKNDGSDGSAFVEFCPDYDGTEMVPKYSVLPSNYPSEMTGFSDAWFHHPSGDRDLLIHLIDAYREQLQGVGAGLLGNITGFILMHEKI